MKAIRNRQNPLELIERFWPNVDKKEFEHITFDPDLKITFDSDMGKERYNITRQHVHDGTLIFTAELIQGLLLPLVNMQSYHKLTAPKDWEKVRGMAYTVGYLRHVVIAGEFKLDNRMYPGVRERIRIPVKCEYMV